MMSKTMMTMKMMTMMMKTSRMITAKSHLDLLDLLHNGRGRLSRVGACVHRVRLDRHGGRRVVKRSGLGAGSRAVVRQHVQRAAAVRALRAVHHVGRARVSAGGGRRVKMVNMRSMRSMMTMNS